MSGSKWFRIIPVAFIMYMLAYMDRINIGVLVPYMQKELHLSSAAAGNISGIFFIGYLFLQIPGGILATKWSAKKFVFWLMILWGILAALTGIVHTESQLLWVRFFLGVAEGGVWPAVLVLLASWFTQKERARANAFWMACLPVSAVVMGPISGILLKSLSWHQVLVIEGLPPIVWAFIWLWLVKDRPAEAAWMDSQERKQLLDVLDNEQKNSASSTGYGAAFKNKTVWGLVVIYLFWMTGFYGYTLWVPSVIKTFTKDPAVMGWLTAVPFTFAFIGMALNSYWSDRRMNRVQHVAIPLVIGAVAMIWGQFVDSPTAKMILLSITAIGVYAPYGPLWAVPTAIVPAAIAGAAMGLQNAIGNVGGYVGPILVGKFKDLTGSYALGFFFLAACLVISAIITVIVCRSMQSNHINHNNQTNKASDSL